MASKKLTEIINEKNEILNKDAASKNKKSPFKNNVVPAIESLLEVKQKVYDIRTRMKERIGHLNTLYDQYYRKVSEIKEENNRKIAELEKTYTDLKGSRINPWPPKGFKGPRDVWEQYCKLKKCRYTALNLTEKQAVEAGIEDLVPSYETEINKVVIPTLESVNETMKHYIKTSKCKSKNDATLELHAQKRELAKRVSFYAENLITKYKCSLSEIKKLALKEREEMEAKDEYKDVKLGNRTRNFEARTINVLLSDLS